MGLMIILHTNFVSFASVNGSDDARMLGTVSLLLPEGYGDRGLGFPSKFCGQENKERTKIK